MKKFLFVSLMLYLLCFTFTACSSKKEKSVRSNGTDFSQLVSITYEYESDFGDTIVKLLNSAAIKQKIGIEPSNVNKITVERVPENEKPAKDTRHNNVIRITTDAGESILSKELFNDFYSKIENALPENINVTIEKVD